MGRKLKRNKPLVVKGWTDASRTRGREGVITAMEPMHNYIDTQVCSDCRHRSCMAKKSDWVGCTGIDGDDTRLKGMCNKYRPDCQHDFDKLCKALGAPPPPEFKLNSDAIASMVAYTTRKRAVERYLHERFMKCRAVTLIVKEGHSE
jgi:hypothetical protein